MKIRPTLQWMALAITAAFSLGVSQAADNAAPRPDRVPTQEQTQRWNQMREQRMAEMVKQLGLTEAQKKKVETLQDKQIEKMRGWRQDTSMTPEQRREKLEASQKEMAAEMKKILTPEQFTKWESLEKERRARRSEGGPRAGAQRGQGQPQPRN